MRDCHYYPILIFVYQWFTNYGYPMIIPWLSQHIRPTCLNGPRPSNPARFHNFRWSKRPWSAWQPFATAQVGRSGKKGAEIVLNHLDSHGFFESLPWIYYDILLFSTCFTYAFHYFTYAFIAFLVGLFWGDPGKQYIGSSSQLGWSMLEWYIQHTSNRYALTNQQKAISWYSK